MKKILIFLLVLIGVGFSICAQEKSSKEKKGDKFFFIYAYDNAIDKYEGTKNLTVSGQRNLAESYRKMKQNTESEQTYAALINNGKELISEDYYNYAMVLKSSGKYSESDVQMTAFAGQKPNDLRAISFLENRSRLEEMRKDNGNFKIREMSINTASQDFGTAYYKDRIVYASSNARPKMIKRRDNRNNEPFFNLYVADVEDGQLKNREFFDKKENGKMHDGPATFSNAGTYMAYSKNVTKDKTADNIIELRIFMREFKDEKWSDPIEFEHNNPAYSLGQPHLSANGNTIYFVSNMPGGFGGTDIYRSTRVTGGAWGKPENLGNVINTEGDEMFPFLDESEKVISFTSDGHYGLGGLDIFSSDVNGTSWGKVINSGAPLNTLNDDYAFISENKTNTGYFSSNRADGSGMDDIYGIEILNKKSAPKTIVGIASNVSKNPLKGTKVLLLDANGNVLNEVVTDADGAYKFVVETDKNFELTGNKEGFLEGRNETSSFGSQEVITAHLQLLEDQKEVVIADEDVVVEKDLGVVIKLNPIYFVYNKSDITPAAKKELDKIIKVMIQFPNMEIELKAHTDCRGSKSYNDDLSQRRAQASADYIKGGIQNPERIYGKGYGETKLATDCACEDEVMSNCSDEDHQKNRRTEFIVKKK
jgi:outer membrane protein OmpA-like peptidoglycan-associated protein